MVAKTSNADVDIITPVVAAATAEVSIDDIINALVTYQPNADIDLIKKAYELANSAHAG